MGQTPVDLSRVEELQAQVAMLSGRAEALLEELDQRIHGRLDRARRALDLPHQLRSHKAAAATIAIGALALAVLSVRLIRRRRVMRRRAVPLLGPRLVALWAPRRSLARRVLEAALVSAASVTTRALVRRSVQLLPRASGSDR